MPNIQVVGVPLLIDFQVTSVPGKTPGLIVPIAHPLPGATIALFRSIVRIHVLNLPHPDAVQLYATAGTLFRASDNVILGGAATDELVVANRSHDAISKFPFPSSELSDREENLDGHYIPLRSTDSMLLLFRTFALPQSQTDGLGLPCDIRLDVVIEFGIFDGHGILRHAREPVMLTTNGLILYSDGVVEQAPPSIPTSA